MGDKIDKFLSCLKHQHYQPDCESFLTTSSISNNNGCKQSNILGAMKNRGAMKKGDFFLFLKSCLV